MENIKISTTQNIDLEYVPAGVGNRILAGLLDCIFQGIYLFLVFFLAGLMSNASRAFYRDDYFTLTLFFIFLLPFLLYHFLCELMFNGQSFGKKIVGIRVVKLDGTQPALGSYLLRSLLRIIDVMLFNGLVAIIAIAASEKSQRLGDMAAGTTVIKLGNKVTLKDTILFKSIENYKVVFPQVELLSDKDVAIIKDVLNYATENEKPEALKKLALRVKEKMGVTTEIKDDQFLKTVLLDYSHFQFEK
jgi:uncharacterized RDD family membrane protein YckC